MERIHYGAEAVLMYVYHPGKSVTYTKDSGMYVDMAVNAGLAKVAESKEVEITKSGIEYTWWILDNVKEAHDWYYNLNK